MYKVLVLGAGMVAKPLVTYLLDNGIKLRIACNTCDNAQKILRDHPNGEIVYWNADNMSELESMIKGFDLVVSLLPYKFHTGVARVCIKYGKHMVTTSYVKEEMAGLDEDARKAGILILNEIGLDPGIDHMSAMSIIDEVHSRGWSIIKFWSVCGALPAPGYIDNPLGYKFSWSPVGVLLASLNGAKYLHNGEIVRIEPKDLFRNTYKYNIKGVGELEVYPNRDSTNYIDLYGLSNIRTMFRGTFRFKGWCETIDLMKRANLLSKDEEDFSGKTFSEMILSRCDQKSGPVKTEFARHFGLEPDSAAIKAFEWLGFFDNRKIPSNARSAFDVVSDRMMEKMILKKNDKDMTVLKHIFVAKKKDGNTEVITSQMVDTGSPANSTSIARTVSLPAAIAAKLILEKKISLKGVYIPVVKKIYKPVLEALNDMGINTVEKYGVSKDELLFSD